jgi:hypothetical protein
VFGGRNAAGEALNDAWAFDVASEQWALLRLPDTAVRPVPRAGHTAFVLPSSSSSSIALLGARYLRGRRCDVCATPEVLTCTRLRGRPQRWAALSAQRCLTTCGVSTLCLTSTGRLTPTGPGQTFEKGGVSAARAAWRSSVTLHTHGLSGSSSRARLWLAADDCLCRGSKTGWGARLAADVYT